MHRVAKQIALYATALLCTLALVATLVGWIYPVDSSTLKHTSSVVYADDGSWLYAKTSDQDKWRFDVELESIDPSFLATLIAYEDQRFYTHHGVDPLAMSRAVWQLITNGRIVSGGSTITMQLARLLHPKDRTISSKLIEIIHAIQLEWRYSKDEILSAYLTMTPYGGNVEGIVAASMRYFAKEPHSLSASEIALLVALPKSPERNRPDKHLKHSIESRNKVLTIARDKSLISEYEYLQATSQQPPTKLHRYPRHAPHISQRLVSKNRTTMTTINRTLQTQLEQWAKGKEGLLAKDTTLSLLVVRNSDSAIQAYLGSHDMFSRSVSGYIDMTRAIRSPGSTLKPFIYALGFQKHIIHPNTLILDQETRFGDYLPHNFSHRFSGEVSLQYALQNSLNIPAVKILQKVGAEEFVAHISTLTGTLKIPKKRISLPIALGGLGISMWQLTQLYVALANGGTARSLHYLKALPNSNQTKRLYSQRSAQMTTAILRQTPAPMGFVNSDHQIAYKTGTSYGYRDTWTLAYDAQYTVALWVGKPNNSIQLKLTGRNTAAPMAFEVFSILNTLLPKKSWGWSANYLLNSVPDGLRYFDTDIEQRRTRFGFVYPREGSRFRSASCDEAIVEIKIQNGSAPYYWYIDDIQKSVRGYSTNIQLPHGAHTIHIIDSKGETISRDIWVDRPEC